MGVERLSLANLVKVVPSIVHPACISAICQVVSIVEEVFVAGPFQAREPASPHYYWMSRFRRARRTIGFGPLLFGSTLQDRAAADVATCLNAERKRYAISHAEPRQTGMERRRLPGEFAELEPLTLHIVAYLRVVCL